MKKLTLFVSLIITVLTLTMTTGCNDRNSNGTSSADLIKLYGYVPDSAVGIFTVDFKKIVALSLLDKFNSDTKFKDFGKKQKFFKDYKDFVDKTGIDPKQDIRAIVVAIFGKFGKKEPDISALINLKYDKQKLLSLLKKSEQDFSETEYNGVKLYSIRSKSGKKIGFFFLKGNIIATGTIRYVKRVINISLGKEKSILDNPKMKPYIEKADNSSLFSFVVEFQEDMKKAKGNNMIKVDLSKAEAIYGSVDFNSDIWSGKMALVSYNEKGNTELANSLNGLKGLASMGGPEVAELVKNISISSTSDSIKLTFKISKELMDKLKSKAEKKVKDFEK